MYQYQSCSFGGRNISDSSGVGGGSGSSFRYRRGSSDTDSRGSGGSVTSNGGSIEPYTVDYLLKRPPLLFKENQW